MNQYHDRENLYFYPTLEEPALGLAKGRKWDTLWPRELHGRAQANVPLINNILV